MKNRTLIQALCAVDFLVFADQAHKALYGGGIEFNWHHEAIAYVLDLIFRKRRQEQVICIPPRSLKSFLISIAYPAWVLGQDPTMPIVCASYSLELAEKPARDCRRLMATKFYREVFPRTIISSRSAAHDFETTRGGGRLTTSVGGTLTGRGGRVLIIDDPMKSDEAASPTARKAVIDWYTGTAVTRLDDKRYGATIVVMQRLHEGDLAGHLIDAGAPALVLPSIAIEDEAVRLSAKRVYRRKAGELLHPTREGKRYLDAQRRKMPAHLFEANYQQNPRPAEGNIVRAEWITRYHERPDLGEGGQIIQSWDTASKDNLWNDYSVCITALKLGTKLYILDVFRDRLKFNDLYEKAVELANYWHPQLILIEDAGSGQQLFQELERRKPAGVAGRVPVTPSVNKQVRMDGQTASIAAGDLVLPVNAHWLGAFEHELLAFPNSKHDDQVDALSQLMAFARTMLSSQITHGQAELIPQPTLEQLEDEEDYGLGPAVHGYDPDLYDPDDVYADMYSGVGRPMSDCAGL